MLPTLFAQYYNMMDGGDWFWGLFMMFFWVLLIVFVVVLILRSGGHWRENNDRASGDEALSVAKKRYAKGEITKEQFDQLKKDLR